MSKFWRLQIGHYSIEDMQAHISEDGGGDGGEEGICATSSFEDLLRNTVWEVAKVESAEVVEMTAEVVDRIYDGYRVYPVEVVRRWTPAEAMAAYRAGEIE